MTAEGKTISVVLIDDHPVVRSGIRMLLEQAPEIRIVGEAERGDRGLELIERLRPDVVLLDMEMPGRSGPEVMRLIQERGLPVKVLALSAYDDSEYIRSLLAMGAYGYLTKDEALDTIVDAVRGVAEGQEGWLSRRAAAQLTSMARTESNRGHDPIELTEREEEVLRCLAKGWSNDQIAEALYITERTVRYHLTNIYQKLHVSTRGEAIAWALREWDELEE
ncbi:response regulator transcription factor [Litorilinea aerophila]|uniref:Response regulator transcription factor n=1 Tax=Litorilinea aerophila TaxID=1204385 RepID=A0A540VB95_9CHLR|nr:response regulator transcription factor [Litorilinea aerophila]MCC9078757.1 response regulator transcription factor [Litorilinea aerophila]GIV78783.1 MAG: DNA-binding response regulator [Litorilinea sp.]